jgi:hypothetical protein
MQDRILLAHDLAHAYARELAGIRSKHRGPKRLSSLLLNIVARQLDGKHHFLLVRRILTIPLDESPYPGRESHV